MNIELTSERIAGLAWATANRNAHNLDAAPLSNEEFAADILNVKCDKFIVAKDEAEKSALASNAELMAIGKEVAQAAPDVQAGAIAAARAVLTQAQS